MQFQRSLPHFSRKLIDQGDFGNMLASQELRLTILICGYDEKVGRQLWDSSLLLCGWVLSSLCDLCDSESAKLDIYELIQPDFVDLPIIPIGALSMSSGRTRTSGNISIGDMNALVADVQITAVTFLRRSAEVRAEIPSGIHRAISWFLSRKALILCTPAIFVSLLNGFMMLFNSQYCNTSWRTSI